MRLFATDVPFDAVVCAHGWMATASVWSRLAARLPFPLVTPELRGRDLEAQATELLAAWPRGRVALLGHSMGGQVALVAAARAPERVAAVGLLCPVPIQGLSLPADTATFFRAAGGDAGALGGILDQACRDLSAEARAALVADALTLDAAQIAATFDAWSNGLPGFDLARVRATVAVVATDDPFLPVALLRAQLVERLPRGRLEVLRGPGHYPHVERPDAVADLLGGLLA